MPITTSPDVGVPPRVFLPESFDPADTIVLAETGAALLDRPLLSPLELENWLIDWSELKAAFFGERARRHIARSQDTRDDALRDASLRFDQEVIPVWKRIEDRLARRLLGCEHRHALDERFHVFLRRAESDAALFREANLELEAREKELVTEYETIMGGSMVRFRGEELTLSQCATHLRDEDRGVREAAWRAMQETRLAERERLDALFDGLLGLRNRIGAQADCADGYREWCFRSKYRFDYGPAECDAFHRAVEAVVVPAVRELRRQRREALGVETLRPWDLEVDPAGAPRTQPVENEAGFAALGVSLFEAVDPALAADFDILVRNDLLDLMSRPGKAPGGFCAMIGDIRLPFIFQNSVGRHSDLMTLLHEGGHAFHAVATRELPVIDVGRAPMEFCEVASMAMEMFGLERLDRVYDAGQASSARRSTLERRLGIFGWIATIDAFQHWIYAHPDQTGKEREAAWVEVHQRFAPSLDWRGIEEQRGTLWHGQRHVFKAPFYYIEYGIALLGALQLWRNYRRDPSDAVARYRAALALGGTRPLPELFGAAGIEFAMDESTLRGVVDDLLDGIRAGT